VTKTCTLQYHNKIDDQVGLLEHNGPSQISSFITPRSNSSSFGRWVYRHIISSRSTVRSLPAAPVRGVFWSNPVGNLGRGDFTAEFAVSDGIHSWEYLWTPLDNTEISLTDWSEYSIKIGDSKLITCRARLE
jgi:hypothetical protein